MKTEQKFLIESCGNRQRLLAWRRRWGGKIEDVKRGDPVPINQIPTPLWLRRQAW